MRTLRVFFMIAVLLVSNLVSAGAIKELLIVHEESIAEEVALMGSFSVEKIFQSRFVTAKAGFDTALESQVDVMDVETLQSFEIACTSHFKKDHDGSMELSETNCEFPE